MILRVFLFVDQFRRIAELAVTLKVAIIASQDTYVEVGGLVSYGVDDSENHRRASDFVDRILKGSKPADLPVEFSTKLVTSINVRTAKALDLTIPPTLLARLQSDRITILLLQCMSLFLAQSRHDVA